MYTQPVSSVLNPGPQSDRIEGESQNILFTAHAAITAHSRSRSLSSINRRMSKDVRILGLLSPLAFLASQR